MRKIIALVDYKGLFGSKQIAVPYRSGMDKELLIRYFKEKGFDLEFIPFHRIDFNQEFKEQIVIYTSQEDGNYHYKSFIEDIILALANDGAIIIPDYMYLRANNNKVFMEIIRKQVFNESFFNSIYCGCYEEAILYMDKINYPVVIKEAEGFLSKGVYIARNNKEFIKTIKKVSKTRNIRNELWDLARSFRHKGYIKESVHRKKFIIQNFIGGLNNDWKILVFEDSYFILKRLNRKNDFRASGSGKFEFDKNIPAGLLDYAEVCFKSLKIPNVSLDIGFDGTNFHLIEFQAVYFGSYTLDYSNFHFKKQDNGWQIVYQKSELERFYVDSIVNYIRNAKF